MKNKTSAFTLAETLLTLAIVGVVATLTVPTLKVHSDEVKFVSAVKKAFATANSATAAVEMKHGDMAFWASSCGTRAVDWYREVMNTVPNPTGAASWTHTNLSGNATVDTMTPNFFTADGMAWQLKSENGACSIIVDTNGEQPPNAGGIDRAHFVAGRASDGSYLLVPYGAPNTPGAAGQKGCTYYIMKNSKMPWFRNSSGHNSCSEYF